MRLDRTSFAKRLGGYAEATELPGQPILEGRLLRMVGLTLEAEGLRAAMGSRCLVINVIADGSAILGQVAYRTAQFARLLAEA